MKPVLLSEYFYEKFEGCTEILEKHDRPYVCITIEVDGQEFAIPFRHHIKHNYAFFTIGEAGLDFKKAVVVEEAAYINDCHPTIEEAEWRIIKGNADRIRYEFAKYIRQYKRALRRPDNPHSKYVTAYSALQYFEVK